MRSPLFFVPGEPIAQGSKRAIAAGVLKDDSSRLKSWRSTVATVARAHGWGRDPIDGPVALGLVYVRVRPRAHFLRGKLRENAPTFPTGPRDVDKLQRAVFDALTGTCWVDDARIVVVRAFKLYGPTPGVAVLVRAIADERPGWFDFNADERLGGRFTDAMLWWP